MALILTAGAVDVSAQSLLKKIGDTVKKEVEAQVKSEVKKAVRSAVNGKSQEGSKEYSKEQSSKSATAQSQSKSQSASKSSSQSKSQPQQPQQSQQSQQPSKAVATQPSKSVTAQSQSTTKSSSSSVVAEGIPITRMDTWKLSFEEGKPHYDFIGSEAEKRDNYYLHSIKYEHPDGVKPFMFTTAVATFKAKDGYHFAKSLKLNEYKDAAEHTVKFKVVDAKTVKVYLTAFTGSMGYDVRITEEMKAYREKIKDLHFIPKATAKMNTPLFDHWQLKLQRRSFENSDTFVRRFIDRNMRAIYAYPTTEQRVDTNGNYVNDAKMTRYTSEYRILSIDILDDDLSDDIPGLVGEWCLIDKKQFIPKACLKDIQYDAKYGNGPAKVVHSPFVFAGGSGTLEDPYLIQTAEQLNAVRMGPKCHYKLIADIDLSNWGNWIPIGASPGYGFLGGGWNKVEKEAHSFMGSFDGNGHVVSGMQIVIEEETPFLTESGNFRAYGLFASFATNPVNYKIKNLGVVNFKIDVRYTNIKKNIDIFAAALSGGINGGTDIENCYSRGGSISIKVVGNEAFSTMDKYGRRPNGTPTVNVCVGGICADGGGLFEIPGGPRSISELMHIERCFNDSSITVDLQNCEHIIYAGGIIGKMNTTHIHECYNSGNITLPIGLDNLMASPHTSTAGGICCYAYIPTVPNVYHKPTSKASFIQNCYNTGQIVARFASGILNLSLADIHLENCYNVGCVIGHEFDNSNGQSTVNPILSQACTITQFGTEFVRKCYEEGNTISGNAWKASAKLGRKVLVSIPEDTHKSLVYKVEPGNVGPFTDVKVDAWYGKAVQWALDKGIISGASAPKFSPDKASTRAEFITLLWRAVGSPKMSAANPFTDVTAADSYYDAAIWAKEQGIVSGTTFAPNTLCTREEVVISLWKSVGSPEELQANQYLDIENHHSVLGKAVSWGYMRSVMGGTASHKFAPKESCTRALVIEVLHRTFK